MGPRHRSFRVNWIYELNYEHFLCINCLIVFYLSHKYFGIKTSVMELVKGMQEPTGLTRDPERDFLLCLPSRQSYQSNVIKAYTAVSVNSAEITELLKSTM